MQGSVCGVGANLLLLIWQEARSSRVESNADCVAMGSSAWAAVCAVAATDITSNIAFKQLGANAFVPPTHMHFSVFIRAKLSVVILISAATF